MKPKRLGDLNCKTWARFRIETVGAICDDARAGDESVAPRRGGVWRHRG